MSNEWIELNGIEDVARAKVEGWEIEVLDTGSRWTAWNPVRWNATWKMRGRHAQPKTRTIALECWVHLPSGTTTTRLAGDPLLDNEESYRRFPAGDITGEVEE